jgi:hypothetical protein
MRLFLSKPRVELPSTCPQARESLPQTQSVDCGSAVPHLEKVSALDIVSSTSTTKEHGHEPHTFTEGDPGALRDEIKMSRRTSCVIPHGVACCALNVGAGLLAPSFLVQRFHWVPARSVAAGRQLGIFGPGSALDARLHSHNYEMDFFESFPVS